MRLFVFILALSSLNVFAQQKADSRKIDSLKKLGREKLIELAVKKINDPAFDPSAYDRVIAKASKSEVVVEFGLSLVFESNGSCFYDKVFVSLAGGSSGQSIVGDCKEPKYYKRSESEKKKIDFIFESINKDNEIGDIPNKVVPEGSTMKVIEKFTHYAVEVSSHSTYSHYNIEKITGNIYEAGHKHYARDWDEKEEFSVIK